MEGAHLPPLDQAGNQSTTERIAARIPGTTEFELFRLARSIWTHLILDMLNAITPVSPAKHVAT